MDSNSPASPFPPIAEYAFLSNCHTGALVAPDGSVDWLCAPRFDSPSVFGNLLDRGAGYFRFAPYGINVPTHRAYDPGTKVLVTTWHTPGGWVEVRDALTMAPRSGPDETTPHTRPPADDDAEHVLVRTADCLAGVGRGRTRLRPGVRLRPDPRAVDPRRPRRPHRRHHRRRAVDAAAHRPARWVEGDARPGRHELEPGDRCSARCPGRDSLDGPTDAETPSRASAATRDFWRRWLGRARMPDHRLPPLRRTVRAGIKGLTYMPTGATVAALTTSLPESPGGERNWDYRYTWMRDSTFTLQALHYLRLDWEADEFMQFVADVEPNEDGALQIMYGIDGRRDLTETIARGLHPLPSRGH